MEVEEKPKETVVEPEVAKDEGFKKPAFIGPRKGVKSLLHKYIQQKKIAAKEQEARKEEEAEAAKEVPVEVPDLVSEEPQQAEVEVKKPLDPNLPYREPPWGGLPERKYSLEELKSGVIERVIDVTKKSFIVFGRLDSCDITMAHPTVSRHHCVLQFRSKEDGENGVGFYVFDLGSTHGTFINKNRLRPQRFARVKVGHVLKLGCSTRLFVLQGPADDEEEESELTVTEMKEKRRQEIEEMKRKEEELRLQAEMEEEKRQKAIEERGISWGMADDADDEPDLSENPFALTTNEELYIDDPKKTLRGWFEREGEELVYDVDSAEKGSFLCKIKLPLDDGAGREVVVEAKAKNKKEAVVQCALEACRYIDKQGLLRQSFHESRKRQLKNWEENDYYDSDEDTFLDRTGQIQKKREKRMRDLGKIQDSVDTYDSLMVKHKKVVDEIQESEDRLAVLMNAMKAFKESEEDDGDALDVFMKNLNKKKPDKVEIKQLRLNVIALKKEEDRLRKLVNLAKPASLPELKPVQIVPKTQEEKPKPVKKPEKVERMEVEAEPDTTEDPVPDTKETEPSTKVIGPKRPDTKAIQEIERRKKKIAERARAKKEKDALKFEGDDDYNNLVWKPPQGQTGDGRTSLNDKLGY